MYIQLAMMISWVAPVNPCHPTWRMTRLRRLPPPTICTFHLGFGLVGQCLTPFSSTNSLLLRLVITCLITFVRFAGQRNRRFSDHYSCISSITQSAPMDTFSPLKSLRFPEKGYFSPFGQLGLLEGVSARVCPVLGL